MSMPVAVFFGELGTLLFRTVHLDPSGKLAGPSQALSSLHEIPLYDDAGRLRFVVKTPKGSWVKYEVAEDEEYNPLRISRAFFRAPVSSVQTNINDLEEKSSVGGEYGDGSGIVLTAVNENSASTFPVANKDAVSCVSVPAHYSRNVGCKVGFLPQTKLTTVGSSKELLSGIKYDGWPLEVLDISLSEAAIGDVYAVKPVAAVRVLTVVKNNSVADGDNDERDGKTDPPKTVAVASWKVIAVSLDDPIAPLLNDLADLKRVIPRVWEQLKTFLKEEAEFEIQEAEPLDPAVKEKITSERERNKGESEEGVMGAEETLNLILECHNNWFSSRSRSSSLSFSRFPLPLNPPATVDDGEKKGEEEGRKLEEEREGRGERGEEWEREQEKEGEGDKGRAGEREGKQGEIEGGSDLGQGESRERGRANAEGEEEKKGGPYAFLRSHLESLWLEKYTKKYKEALLLDQSEASKSKGRLTIPVRLIRQGLTRGAPSVTAAANQITPRGAKFGGDVLRSKSESNKKIEVKDAASFPPTLSTSLEPPSPVSVVSFFPKALSLSSPPFYSASVDSTVAALRDKQASISPSEQNRRKEMFLKVWGEKGGELMRKISEPPPPPSPRASAQSPLPLPEVSETPKNSLTEENAGEATNNAGSWLPGWFSSTLVKASLNSEPESAATGGSPEPAVEVSENSEAWKGGGNLSPEPTKSAGDALGLEDEIDLVEKDRGREGDVSEGETKKNDIPSQPGQEYSPISVLGPFDPLVRVQEALEASLFSPIQEEREREKKMKKEERREKKGKFLRDWEGKRAGLMERIAALPIMKEKEGEQGEKEGEGLGEQGGVGAEVLQPKDINVNTLL